MTHAPHNHHPRAFTLVEMLLAVIVGALVAAIAMGTLNALSRTRDTARDRSELRAHARYALTRIQRDLANACRFPRPHFASVANTASLATTTDTAPQPAADAFALWTVAPPSPRAKQPTGELWLVRYFLYRPDPAKPATLYRQRTPAPPAAATDLTATSASATASPPNAVAIAHFVRSFRIEATNTRQWQRPWPDLYPPRLVRVTLTLQNPNSRDTRPLTVTRTFALGPASPNWFLDPLATTGSNHDTTTP